MLGMEPGRDVTTRDGLLLDAGRPHSHGRLSSLDMGELEFVCRILKILEW